MHRSILFYFAGLTCGLFAATWNVRPAPAPQHGQDRPEALGIQGVDVRMIEDLVGRDVRPEPIATVAAPAQDPAPAAEKPEESDRQRLERKVRKLLKDNGTEAVQKRTMEAMRGQFEKMGLPPEFGTKFLARFDLDHIMDLAVKVYADHLDEATVDALAAFFLTPSGRKLAEATPDITVELTEASMEYGQKIGMEVGAEMGK